MLTHVAPSNFIEVLEDLYPFLTDLTERCIKCELRRLAEPELATPETVSKAIIELLNELRSPCEEPGLPLRIYGHPAIPDAPKDLRHDQCFLSPDEARQAANEHYSAYEEFNSNAAEYNERMIRINHLLILRLEVGKPSHWAASLPPIYKPRLKPSAAAVIGNVL